MKTTREYWMFIMLSATGWMFYGCRKPYSPNVISSNNNYLVVEGIIVAGQDSTIIKLSRSVNLSGTTTTNPEKDATVIVEGDQGTRYTLIESGGGRYVAPPLSLDNNHKYHLLINTADKRTYASDFEPVKITPPIDSLYYTINAKNDGLTIRTSAHDASKQTRYYRWDFTETYIYVSDIPSYYIFDPTQPYDTLKSVSRRPDQLINTCYVTRNSTSVLLNSSAALSQDVIEGNPIAGIADTSEKILHRYSIIVRQYALTSDAYNFWYNIKRNTQQIGTIFDVQPSEVPGNIHCTSNPSEPVIGYVSVSSISQKRIFIDRSELPVWPYPQPATCAPYFICWNKGSPVDPDLQAGNVIPLGPILPGSCDTPPRPGYDVQVAYYFCVDCRYHLNGVTGKPDFWK
jgi:uncharacterized protein DUF4249